MASKESTPNFASLRERVLGKSGKEYWRSIEEYVDAPEFEEFVKREYPAHAEEWDKSLNRRNFLKVMGASLAFAGLTGCVVQPTERIIPYVNQPEDLIPGKPMFFATSMTLSGSSIGILAKSNEGRPTKIEGNPEHPGSLGATDVLTQASLLNLYDPDRSQEIRFRGTSKTWLEFVNQVRAMVEEVGSTGGAGVRFLTETIVSPTLIDQFRRLLAELPNAKWYQYEPINKDNVLGGTRLAFGAPHNVVYRLDAADRLLRLQCPLHEGLRQEEEISLR
jgi:MoCo/4Fe-4S cofactor protein with predicted Tat translocation signal